MSRETSGVYKRRKNALARLEVNVSIERNLLKNEKNDAMKSYHSGRVTRMEREISTLKSRL